jgi:hypothetical protein
MISRAAAVERVGRFVEELCEVALAKWIEILYQHGATEREIAEGRAWYSAELARFSADSTGEINRRLATRDKRRRRTYRRRVSRKNPALRNI